jgi:misacylated tRNA(Ala) deacylase
MTKALYLQDCYSKEFDATVTKADGKYIILDQTIFYPVGGGQPADKGVLKKGDEVYKVVFVKKTPEGISHEVDKEGLKEGDKVEGEIDWDYRYTIMRHHTAAHLLSAVIYKETGALITGNQLYEDKARIDFNLEQFDKDKAQNFVDKANELIQKEYEVRKYTLEKEEAFKDPELFRLKNVIPDAVKELRIVEIYGYDKQACGGNHINNIREIKKIKFLKAENKGKNNRRIYFALE